MRLVLVVLLGSIIVSGSVRAQEEMAPSPESSPLLEGVDADPQPDRFELRAEFLYWYLRKLRLAPVLTSGLEGSSATLGDFGTVVLRGGDRIESRHDRYVGVRAKGDWWLDDDRDIALEADVFFLERDSTHFTVRPGQVPVLAIPYVDAATGQARSFVIAGFNPERGDVSGGTRIYSRMEFFGQEGNVLVNLARAPDRELNLIVGTRFLQLRERLDLTSSSKSRPDGATVFGLEDHFQTFDKFYGVQTGLSGNWRFGRLILDGKAAIALGADEQLIRNKGVRIHHTPHKRIEQPFGLFILPSDRGAFDRCSFDVVTDLRLNAGFELTHWATITVGYTLLTWSGPVRPGEQVRPVNLAQVNGQGSLVPVAPRPSFREDFFFAQGVNVGLALRW